jgi:hypothetical protein
MIRLRVYRGPETVSRFSRTETADGQPDVIPLDVFLASRKRLAAETPLSRAKALHQNRFCRFCGHSAVTPVTLNDGQRDGSGQYVPGSATLVGFHCRRCRAEWPVFAD